MKRFVGLFFSSLLVSFSGCSEPSQIVDGVALSGPEVVLDIQPGCNPLTTTSECLLPLPSRFFEVEDASSATGVRWAFQDSQFLTRGGENPLEFNRYNKADGASPVMPILVHFGVDIHPDFLIPQRAIEDSLGSKQNIALIDLETGTHLPVMVEMDANLRESEFHNGRHALIIRPMIPMKMGHRHAVVIKNGLTDTSGRLIEAPPGFVALRDKRPTNYAPLDEHRRSYEVLFARLEQLGHTRGDLHLAWDFMVASDEHILGPITSMREQALAYVNDNGFSYVIESVQKDVNDNISRVIKGTFDVPCFLNDANQIETDSVGNPLLQGLCTYPFSMAVPQKGNEAGNLRLTLIGHGIFGEGSGYISDHPVAHEKTQPLAQAIGSVAVATNWIGLSKPDKDLIITEVVNDLNRLTVITDRLAQSLVNNIILMEMVLRALQFDPELEVVHAPLIGYEEVGYYGISLGGIQGTSLTALAHNRIKRAILAVPGGAWSTMLPRSVVYQPIKGFMDLLYPDPLTQLIFNSFLQAMFDFTDPINLSKLLKNEDGSLKAKIIIQEAIGDCQVPNLNTRLLARQLGVTQLVPAIEDVFGLRQSESSEGAALAQYLLPEGLAEYMPPDAAVVPTEDNGTHSNATFSGPGFEQIISLIRDGEIVQLCDGPCDPD